MKLCTKSKHRFLKKPTLSESYKIAYVIWNLSHYTQECQMTVYKFKYLNDFVTIDCENVE